MGFVALVQLVSTVGMTVVIWFVQLVQYPLFAAVPGAPFVPFHNGHVTRITFIVGPLMLAEAGSALLWALSAKDTHLFFRAGGLVLVAVVWGSTYFIQIPLHRTLDAGYDAEVIARLVNTNWIRTIAWTMRGVMVIALAASLPAALRP